MDTRDARFRVPVNEEPPDLTTLILSPFAETATIISDIVTSRRTHEAIVRIIVLGGIVTSAIVGAILAYLTFYWLFIPELGLQQNVYLQYGHSRTPYARIDLLPVGDYLANDQQYDVSLDLIVPNNQQNLELGNFMVTADFRTITDVTKLVISRPASASYTPSAIRAMLAVSDVRALLGMPHSAAQTIAVPLVNRKILQRWHDSERISHVIVTVGRQDAHLGKTYQGGKGELQVYQAVMHFDAHFSGLRYIMYHYRFLSFVTFTALFSVFEIVTALGAWAFIAYRRGSISPYADVDASRISRSTGGPGSPTRYRRALPSGGGRGRTGTFKRSSGADLRRRSSAGRQQPPRYGMDDPSLGRRFKEEEEEEDLRSASDGDEAGSWEGIEAVASGFDRSAIKREDEEAGSTSDIPPSVGGSSTTRGTRSSLGVSDVTRSSGTTASSLSSGRPPINRQASIDEASTQESESGTE